MDRFEDMRCFVAVVDRGSVTRAAESMSIAPSAVSRRIKDLETRLGAQLLIRTTRRMSLTDAGQAFYDRCRLILSDVEEAEAEVADASRALTGPLRITAPLSFGLAYLSPMLADFAAEHPGLELDLDLSDRQADLVGEGFDVAVRIGQLKSSTLIARKLCEVAMILCASPDLKAAYPEPATPEDLSVWPALAYVGSDRGDIWRYDAPDGTQATVQVRPVMRSNNGEAIRDAAIRGLGVCLQPSFIVKDALADGRLVQVMPGLEWPRIGLYTVYPETRHLSAKARAFADYLRERLGGATPSWEAGLAKPAS